MNRESIGSLSGGDWEWKEPESWPLVFFGLFSTYCTKEAKRVALRRGSKILDPKSRTQNPLSQLRCLTRFDWRQVSHDLGQRLAHGFRCRFQGLGASRTWLHGKENRNYCMIGVHVGVTMGIDSAIPCPPNPEP